MRAAKPLPSFDRTDAERVVLKVFSTSRDPEIIRAFDAITRDKLDVVHVRDVLVIDHVALGRVSPRRSPAVFSSSSSWGAWSGKGAEGTRLMATPTCRSPGGTHAGSDGGVPWPRSASGVRTLERSSESGARTRRGRTTDRPMARGRRPPIVVDRNVRKEPASEAQNEPQTKRREVVANAPAAATSVLPNRDYPQSTVTLAATFA